MSETPMVRAAFLCALLFSLSAVAAGAPAVRREPASPAVEVPNAGFTAGDDRPAHWTLSGGRGRWVDRDILEVTGAGGDSNHWLSERVPFAAGGLYRFRMRARRLDGSGTVIGGPRFAGRDFRHLSGSWRPYEFIFRVPDDIDGGRLRLGQWNATGTVQFDSVDLERAVPVHRRAGAYLLGEGESITGGRYEFHGTFGRRGGNFHRTLHSATARFNTDRWVLDGDAQVTYRFGLPGHRILSGELALHVNYHVRGGCVAEASRDGTEWHALVRSEEVGEARAALPAALVPAPEVFLRLRASARESSFQVNRVGFTAELGGGPPEGTGATLFAGVEGENPDVAVESLSLEDDPDTGSPVLLVEARNRRGAPLAVRMGATVEATGGAPPARRAREVDVPAAETVSFTVPLGAASPGEREVRVALASGRGDPVTVSLAYAVPELHRSDYGRRIAGLPEDEATIWWCAATRKVSRRRGPPAATSGAARLESARNDFEAVQVVVRPRRKLAGFRAAASDLAGPDGATISAGNVRILRVAYHFVRHPTDSTGVRGYWPDALPPLSAPLDLSPGANQPLWILIHVPADASPGDYSGGVTLTAGDWTVRVPLRLHVWDFALPRRNHLETAFGLSTREVFRYHRLESEADRRRVLDLYFRSFAEHRISPYDPVPLDPIRVRFVPGAEPPRAEVDFEAFDAEMSRAVEEFRFTNFRLPVRGLGGGSFHSRREPGIAGFGAETPEYRALFSSQAKQLEEHLREKGWLDMAYVYWFDEPAPRDYPFVIEGMERLDRYAPGLQRMLTEEPRDELAGAVDIWCPLSANYDHEAAARRKASGERFWWYVCTGPKAPYCTLFIDHPATELRVWLWQTWKYGISGILVWRANYWTSGAAYPERPQDPYADPMGYVSGYSTPRGVKRFWGNGDGRFIYPPERAAVPGKAGPAPVLAPPVSSIRWEMLREGIEDWEFLWLLRDLLRERRDDLRPADIRRFEALLEVPAEITASMTAFTTDPGPIHERRAAVAAAIEELRSPAGDRPGAGPGNASPESKSRPTSRPRSSPRAGGRPPRAP